MKQEEKRMNQRISVSDRIRGCIYGGAVGDALGYPVEFLSEDEIFREWGPKGITRFEPDPYNGKAMISDDTQMTLFTACGLLVGDSRRAMGREEGLPRYYVAKAYLDWLKTQTSSMKELRESALSAEKDERSWLLDVSQLYSRRAPGITCLNALQEEAAGRTYEDYVEAARNNSKGCGGIMRVAPIGVRYKVDMDKLDKEAAQLAAITHGHSLGYMTAAVLVHIVNRIIFPPQTGELSLKDIVVEARDAMERIFAGDPYLPKLTQIIDLAVSLAEDGSSKDLDNIHRLGEGWVAEETLGISLYCALRYQDDFSAGVIAAVNHKGDSDSTGAVTGNILGALCGYEALEDKWKKDLELENVILEIADDLGRPCPVIDGVCTDPGWEKKYLEGTRP